MEAYSRNTELVHRNLRIRLAIYAGLSLMILAFLLYYIFTDGTGITFPAIGLVVGLAAGTLFSRILNITWDKDAGKVIAGLDTYGFIILVIYITIEIFREKIVEGFVHGPAVATTSFALLAGILFGRILGMRRKIKGVIEENS